MPWIQLEPSVFDHRKTLRLSVRLGMRETHLVGHLGRLWTWALSSAPSGDLGDLEPSVIARAADWTSDLLDVADAELFVAELLAVGFLDRLECGGLRLHGWRERHQQWAERRESEARTSEQAAEQAELDRKARHAESQADYRARRKVVGGVPPHPRPLSRTRERGAELRADDSAVTGDRSVADAEVTREGAGDRGVIAPVIGRDVTGDQRVIEGDRGVTSRVMGGDITPLARPDRTGPEITGENRTGVSPPVPPAAAEGRPPAPRKRGVLGGRVHNSGGYFDGAGAAALTGQWLRWPAGEDRPPWEAWVRSQGRDDLVNRPPPDALVASVSDALERQRGRGIAVNGCADGLEGMGHG